MNINHVNFPFGTIKGYCIVLYCIVLYCIVLYCIVLYCIVLYCIVLLLRHSTQNQRQLSQSKPHFLLLTMIHFYASCLQTCHVHNDRACGCVPADMTRCGIRWIPAVFPDLSGDKSSRFALSCFLCLCRIVLECTKMI